MLKLLVLQPTAFCNINCTYCYLPNRNDKKIMRLNDLRTIIKNVKVDFCFADDARIVWHAGEPLVCGLDYFAEVVHIVRDELGTGIKLGIQTNGTLINEEWCKFFKSNSIDIGISIDGPSHIHDFNRKNRNGRGTFQKAIAAAEMLQKFNIDYGIISVISSYSSKFPEEIIQLADRYNWNNIAFNVEETEGVNVSSSLNSDDFRGSMYRFYEMLISRSMQESNKIRIREVNDMFKLVFASKSENVVPDVNIPFSIITVSVNGDWSTFCPELNSVHTDRFGSFSFGNLIDSPISKYFDSQKFDIVYDEIKNGIENCRSTCEYFPVCGGGRPANKYGEHRRFDVAQTEQCRAGIMPLADAVIDMFSELMDRVE